MSEEIRIEPSPGGIVEGGGYCTPSDALAAAMPTLSVKRGGMRWPTELEALRRQEAARDRERYRIQQHHKTKRVQAALMTVRTVALFLAAAVAFLALLDALPWQ